MVSGHEDIYVVSLHLLHPNAWIMLLPHMCKKINTGFCFLADFSSITIVENPNLNEFFAVFELHLVAK